MGSAIVIPSKRLRCLTRPCGSRRRPVAKRRDADIVLSVGGGTRFACREAHMQCRGPNPYGGPHPRADQFCCPAACCQWAQVGALMRERVLEELEIRGHRPSARTRPHPITVDGLKQQQPNDKGSRSRASPCRCRAALSRDRSSPSCWRATNACLMLMIWSSRARNTSPSPVVCGFFGRIAALCPMRRRNQLAISQKTNLQAFVASIPES